MSKIDLEPTSIEQTYAEMRLAVSKLHKEADPLTLELTFNLVHTTNLFQNQISELSQLSELTPAGFNVLGLLSHNVEGMPLHEIGRLLLVSRANVTGLIDSLESKALVERVDHATDRRVYLARITKKGLALLNQYRPEYFKMIAHLASALTATDKKNLIALLKKWRTTLEPTRKGQ